MLAVAQRLRAAGLPMTEFPQTVPNLTEASQNLFELIKGRNLIVYPDADLRLAVKRAGSCGDCPRLAHLEGQGLAQN